MIQIIMKNGNIYNYKPDEYTDYKYDRKCFIVIKGQKWVGIFNIDSAESIIVKD